MRVGGAESGSYNHFLQIQPTTVLSKLRHVHVISLYLWMVGYPDMHDGVTVNIDYIKKSH